MNLLAVRLAALLLCLWAVLAGAAPAGDGLVAIPPLTARVTDLTGTLSAGEKAGLEQRLAEFEARKGAQVVVLMLPTTQPETVEQFGIRLFDVWKVGRKGVDDGVMLIVAKNDRRLRIEVGYGLEGALNDATAKRIVSDVITPLFKTGDFHGGIAAGVDAILKVVEGEALPPPPAGAGLPAAAGIEDSGGFLSLSDMSETMFYGLLLAIVIGGAILRFVLGNFLGSTLVGAVTGGIGWLFIGGLSGIIGGFLVGLFLALFGLDM
ncbi:MAG: YgcG family protein, partial [Rhodocyclaceae bacterium]|nr:YgcG family protein [Rhodocyclaceae bacterium]